jgi:hypothetical protein
MSEPLEIQRIRAQEVKGVRKSSRKETDIEKRDIATEKTVRLDSRKKKEKNKMKKEKKSDFLHSDSPETHADDPDHGIIDIVI